MATEPGTRICRTAQNIQHTYSLNRRIYDVKIYPVQSPQGATILIYGHENGVVLVWRGGQRLKTAKPADATHKDRQNGASTEEVVMVIDSDDETPARIVRKSLVDQAEFEDEPAESASGMPEIVQTLDLPLGTAVFHVAVLTIGTCSSEDAVWDDAAILKEKIVFAVSCATPDIYLFTLPLTPPSHESKSRLAFQRDLRAGSPGKGAWGETVTVLRGPAKASAGLAMTLVKQERRGEGSRSVEQPSPTRVVVAAHSREAKGTLRLWDVPLGTQPGASREAEPFQTQYLVSPLTSIAFNPHRPTQLLAVSGSQAARVYDYTLASLPTDDVSEGPFPDQGSWLLSLYAPFVRGSVPSRARKPILAASWVSQGRAILALLADGQWGIWDLDGASPSVAATKLLGRHSGGLRGSAMTTFSATGYLEGTSPLRNPASLKPPPAPASAGEFVPMTPHTRRDALAASTGGPERLAAVRGGVDVAQLPPLDKGSTAAPEEAAVLWLGGADPVVAVIPDVARFWDAQLRHGVGGGVNLFGGARPTRMLRLTDLGAGLLGERCISAHPVVRFPRHAPGLSVSAGQPSSPDGLPVGVLVHGESRLVFVRERDDGAAVTSRLLGARNQRFCRPPADRCSANAIIALPRPETPSSVAYFLGLSRANDDAGAANGHRLLSRSLGGKKPKPDFRPRPAGGTSAPGSGLLFAAQLAEAADEVGEDTEAEKRDFEAEMLDIVEIDRELELMETDRGRGTKRVFFEDG